MMELAAQQLRLTMALSEHPTNPISERIIGAAIEVHRQVGPGLLESIYHACLTREFELRGIAFQSELVLPLEYKGVQLPKAYVLDFLVEDAVIVELKSIEHLLPVHRAQLMTYIHLVGVSCGLLMNFNVELLPMGLRRILL